MRSTRFLLTFCALALAGCQKEAPLCGFPAFANYVSYEIVDANTGQDYFAGAGRPSGDSLRLLANTAGPSLRAVKLGGRVRLGPAPVFGRPTIIHFLRFSTTDIDTVVVTLRYGPTPQQDPCGYGPALDQVDITYNGRPGGTFRASVATDSLDGFKMPLWGRVVKLRKSP